jgi:hypothetical protein
LFAKTSALISLVTPAPNDLMDELNIETGSQRWNPTRSSVNLLSALLFHDQGGFPNPKKGRAEG